MTPTTPTTTFRESLRALKATMAAATREACATFEAQTGLVPRALDIELDALDVSSVGSELVAGPYTVRVGVTLRGVDLE